jgi:hypothetical protein
VRDRATIDQRMAWRDKKTTTVFQVQLDHLVTDRHRCTYNALNNGLATKTSPICRPNRHPRPQILHRNGAGGRRNPGTLRKTPRTSKNGRLFPAYLDLAP